MHIMACEEFFMSSLWQLLAYVRLLDILQVVVEEISIWIFALWCEWRKLLLKPTKSCLIVFTTRRNFGQAFSYRFLPIIPWEENNQTNLYFFHLWTHMKTVFIVINLLLHSYPSLNASIRYTKYARHIIFKAIKGKWGAVNVILVT